MSEVAWHYTTGEKWQEIEADGMIRPTGAGIERGERPAVWFSLRATWEPTATKGIIKNGEQVWATLEELEQYGRGLFRIGVDPAALIPWDQYVALSGVSARHARGLADVARDLGADPDEWLASFDPVPRSEWARVEVRYRGTWSAIWP